MFSRQLVKNTGVYVLIGLLGQGLIFLLWLVLARWLAPSQIGLYALVMFVIEFFSAVAVFGLDSAITRFYYAKEKISVVLGNALTIFLGSVLLSLILFFFTAKLIPLFISGLADILDKNLLLFSAIILTNSLANFVFVHYASLKKATLYAKFQLVKAVSFCLVAVILAYLGWGIWGVFYALLFSAALVIILFFVKERNVISLRGILPSAMRPLVSYGFPLMLYAVFGTLAGYFGRLLLDKYTDLTDLGVYSFFLVLTLQINGLWASFNRAWTPEIFSRFSVEGQKTLKSVKSLVFFVSFAYLAVLALLIVFGESFFFKSVLKEPYLSNIHLFYILLLGPLFSGIGIVTYPLYFYQHKTTRILFISFLLSGINILLTFFMVKYLSQTGAALSFFIVAILTNLAYLIAFKKTTMIPKEIINWSVFLSVLMIFSATLLLKTSSSIIFLALVISGAILAFKKGGLAGKINILNYFNGRTNQPQA